MIIKTKYICEKCNTEYDTESECAECENSHADVESYANAVYDKGRKYPIFIRIDADDGHRVAYSFLTDMGETPVEDPVDSVEPTEPEEPDNDG
jgi:hypothetical protein